MRTENGLSVEVAEGVAHVTLDRPERLNALSRRLTSDVMAAFDSLGRDESVRVILVTGAGERAFCAGADLKEIADGSQNERLSAMPLGGTERSVYEIIASCPKPVVAALNGDAVGGGSEIALACDIRLAADHARLGFPEAKRGLGAHFAALMLPRLVPRGFAYEMLYSGELITAQEAHQWGLVNHVVPGADLAAQAGDLCASIAANAPLTVQRYKALITQGLDLPLAAGLRLSVGPNPYTSEDRIEGAAAFIEKRQPRWKGR